MKQTFFYLFLLVSPLFLSSCLLGGGGASDSFIIAKSAIDTKEKNKRDRNRSNDSNRGECGEEDDCEEICEEVYNEDGDRENEGKVERCLELPYKTAINFEDILEVIEEPYYDDLKNIESKHFEEFLDISIAPWVEKTKRLNNEEAENLLRWIASESNISKALESASENYEDFELYEGVEQLFEEIAPSLASYTNSASRRCAQICSATTKKTLAKGESFWNITYDSNNAIGQEMACEIIGENCDYNAVTTTVQSSDCPKAIQLHCFENLPAPPVE